MTLEQKSDLRLAVIVLLTVFGIGVFVGHAFASENIKENYPLVHFSNGDRVYYEHATDVKADCKGWTSYGCYKIMVGKNELERVPSASVIRVDWVNADEIEKLSTYWLITTKSFIKEKK